MRIFLVLDHKANGALAENTTWYRNLYEPLIDLGHEVVLFNSALGWEAKRQSDSALLTQFSHQLMDAFIRAHQQRPVDLFFSYLMDGMIDLGVIEQIRKQGVITCNFSCNNIHQFDHIRHISTHMDYNLYAEKFAGALFQEIGAKAIWWPMAANPNYYFPRRVKKKYPVSFIGTNYAYRAHTIYQLLIHQIQMHVFGVNWKIEPEGDEYRSRYHHLYQQIQQCKDPLSALRAVRKLEAHTLKACLNHYFPTYCHPPVSDTQFFQLLNQSEIVLGILDVVESHDLAHKIKSHVHLREFEVPMCGALYLTSFSEELLDYYEPDKEILVYASIPECVDKINYYLKHPNQAQKIQKAGRKRALKDHTYHKRFQTLFKQLQIF